MSRQAGRKNNRAMRPIGLNMHNLTGKVSGQPKAGPLERRVRHRRQIGCPNLTTCANCEKVVRHGSDVML